MADLGLSIANVSIEFLTVATTLINTIVSLVAVLVLVFQTWLDRHKVPRLVKNRAHEKKKIEERLIDKISARITEDATTTRHSSPERDSV